MATENTELVTIAKESGLAAPQIDGLLSKFGESFNHAKNALEHAKGIKVTSENQTAEMEEARQARIELKNIRVEAEHTRKELKEQSLREGKAIDGMANIIKAMIVPVEEYLEKQEKFAENLAKERKARISAERLNILLELTDVPNMYSFESMEQDVFEKLVAELKAAKDAKLAAEKQIELDRLAKEKAEREEQERVRAENAKLKAEAEAKEAALAKEREAVEAERKAADAKLAAERAEAQAKIDAERKAREAIEQAERDRVAAETAKKAAEAEAERVALLSPDKDKLVQFAAALDTIRTSKLPAVKSNQAQLIVNKIDAAITKLAISIRQEAQEL